MLSCHDQIGRLVELTRPASRIVSLVPSITELLFDLGVGDQVVGRTKFCVYPQPIIQTIPKIGGTKTVKAQVIHDLHPDLIIASKEENIEEQVADAGLWDGDSPVPTYVSNVIDLPTSIDMIKDIGTLVRKEEAAAHLSNSINAAAAKIDLSATEPALYLIWRKPYMSIGGDTYISAMMPYAGYYNVLHDHKRYPSLDAETIAALNPRHILLSSEPFPFKDRHIEELQELCPTAKISLVDGEHYSWYGSRMLKALEVWGQL